MIKLPARRPGTGIYNVNPSKIIALGLNYSEHIAESVTMKAAGIQAAADQATPLPEEPILFPKLPSSVIGPDEPIVIPAYLKDYKFDDLRVDYEAELAFVVKDRCKNVPEGEAMRHVLGYLCLNDVSQRNFQKGDKSGWFRGKSLDTFCPVGPALVPADAVKDPHNLRIECRLNGKTVQLSNTSRMIFKIPAILSFISRHFALEPGDIISTGTPSGVGALKHGDVVEVEIEGIGVLRNPVIEEGFGE